MSWTERADFGRKPAPDSRRNDNAAGAPRGEANQRGIPALAVLRFPLRRPLALDPRHMGRGPRQAVAVAVVGGTVLLSVVLKWKFDRSGSGLIWYRNGVWMPGALWRNVLSIAVSIDGLKVAWWRGRRVLSEWLWQPPRAD